MSKEYEVVKENSHTLADLTMCILSGGLYAVMGGCGSTTTYTVRDGNGVEREVTARDKKELGEKISRGEFD